MNYEISQLRSERADGRTNFSVDIFSLNTLLYSRIFDKININFRTLNADFGFLHIHIQSLAKVLKLQKYDFYPFRETTRKNGS